MKLKREVQGIIIGIITLATILVVTTIDSRWSTEYLIFIVTNIGVISAGAILLKRYGRID